MNEQKTNCCPTCGSLLRDQQAHVDLNANTFVLRDQQVQLMPRMAELLEVLLRRAPAVVPHETIWVQLYGTVGEPQDMQRAVTTCICRLRDVLRPLGADIQNVARVGYRFVSDVDAVSAKKPKHKVVSMRRPTTVDLPIWIGYGDARRKKEANGAASPHGAPRRAANAAPKNFAKSFSRAISGRGREPREKRRTTN